MGEHRQAKKSLGQHFLRCDWVIDTLITSAELKKTDTVLEIGPGTGVLTRPLATEAREVITVEKDETLAAELALSLSKEGTANVRIITGDILKLISHVPPYDKIVANIPYYLTGRLIRILLESPTKPKIITLTIQKEVSERIVAQPPHNNLLALAVQAYGTPKIVKIVPASCFAPPPKIDSAILTISDISDDFFTKNHIGQKEFFALARAAFGQKRKTLANSLASIVGSKEKSLAIIRAVGLKNTIRPEELSLQNWVDMVKFFTEN